MLGRFIIFEGGDGAGKSTLARALKEALEADGIDVVLTREPGGTPGAEEIRQLAVTGEADRFVPETHMTLHYGARFDHIERLILPALVQGKIVLCDRFEVSTAQYQLIGQNASLDLFRGLHDHVVSRLKSVITTATYVHCDLDPAVAQARLEQAKREWWDGLSESKRELYQKENPAGDTYDELPASFHEKLRSGRDKAISYIDPMFEHHILDTGGTVEENVAAARKLLDL